MAGVFGSGKTALKYQIEHEAIEQDALVWSLSESQMPEQLLDFTDLKRHSASIATVVFNVLLWEVANRVLADAKSRPALYGRKAIETLKTVYPSLAERMKDFGKRIAKSTKVTPGLQPFEVDLEKVMQSRGGSLASMLPLDTLVKL